ncbi:MAG: nitronate monooxygenase [Rhodoferax sp.]|nr:nitronate monooxygenase [Rhodoferax sp.]
MNSPTCSLTTPLCTQLGIRHPIFGFSHSVDVSIAITRAGGFAVLGVARDDPEHIAQSIRQIRNAVGDRPFGVDLMFPRLAGDETDVAQVRKKIPAAHQAFVEHLTQKYKVPPATKPHFFTETVRSEALFSAQLSAVLESDANLVAAAVGVPAEVIDQVKRRGKVALALVGAVKHAKAAIEAGVDILVAQGYDAGGHTGPVGTFTLVPQIIEAANGLPVIAAGGVGHGRQIAASLAMGAQGVWLGTAWLTTHELHLQDALVDSLITARSEDTVLTRSHSGKSCRILKSGWTEEWSSPKAPVPLPMPYQQALTGPLVAAVEEHGVKGLLYTPAGQSVAWFNQRESVNDVFNRLLNETKMALDSMRRNLGAS